MKKSSGSTETKTFNGNTYYHLKLTKEDWCTYQKDCPIKFNIPNGDYCWVCKYHVKRDIPSLLFEGRKSEENNFCTAISNS